MADLQHNILTGGQLHEPKGVAAAAANLVYVSDGANSGAWSVLPLASVANATSIAAVQSGLDAASITVDGDYALFAHLEDISTASSIIVPILKNSTFVRATVVLAGPITVADANISFKNAGGASMGTNVTVPFTGSAKGDQIAFTATGNNVLVGPTWIEIATDGLSTDAQRLSVLLEFTAQLN